MSMPSGTVDKRFKAANACSSAIDDLTRVSQALRGSVHATSLGTRECRAFMANARASMKLVDSLLDKIEGGVK